MIQIEFGMPFKAQAVPREWQWGAIGIFNPRVDYQRMAKRIVRNLPNRGPTRVRITDGERLLAAWSRDEESIEQHGL
jgi:hypothetical protein